MREPSRLDVMLNREFERMQRERAAEDARLTALRDPFKERRTEPGRALVRHGRASKGAMRTSLGGQHS